VPDSTPDASSPDHLDLVAALFVRMFKSCRQRARRAREGVGHPRRRDVVLKRGGARKKRVMAPWAPSAPLTAHMSSVGIHVAGLAPGGQTTSSPFRPSQEHASRLGRGGLDDSIGLATREDR